MRYQLKTVPASLVIALTALLLVAFTVAVVKADTFKIDKEGQVDQVIDGDTFNLKSGDKIRLADIDSPDSNDPGYQRATDYLTDLFNQYGWYVFLDVDNVTIDRSCFLLWCKCAWRMKSKAFAISDVIRTSTYISSALHKILASYRGDWHMHLFPQIISANLINTSSSVR